METCPRGSWDGRLIGILNNRLNEPDRGRAPTARTRFKGDKQVRADELPPPNLKLQLKGKSENRSILLQEAEGCQSFD